jgi:prepilin-type N-terminal cleavage/methylation domain-containing protein
MGRIAETSKTRQHRRLASGRAQRGSHSIVNHQSSIINSRGFTLIELLVVIGVIALLLAIFMPVMRLARERGQRAVCLSNLKQLTLAWTVYADDHDGKLVSGAAFVTSTMSGGGGPTWTAKGWVGLAFRYGASRSAVIENPDKGALWPYLRDVDIYRCPRGRTGHALTYSTVLAANNNATTVEGTIGSHIGNDEVTLFGKRVGDTVLKLTRITDIVSPGAAERAVFVDKGDTPGSWDFYVDYLYRKWKGSSPPPLHHNNGITLSMADAHAEYWRWRGRETVHMPRTLMPYRDVLLEVLEGSTYEPQTEDGLYDLRRLQRATWGRLGYVAEGGT